jgi:hypothetical protein
MKKSAITRQMLLQNAFQLIVTNKSPYFEAKTIKIGQKKCKTPLLPYFYGYFYIKNRSFPSFAKYFTNRKTFSKP